MSRKILLILLLFSAINIFAQSQNDYSELNAEYRSYLNYVYIKGDEVPTDNYNFKVYSILLDSNDLLIDTIFNGKCFNFSCNSSTCGTRQFITASDAANVVCNNNYSGINAIWVFINSKTTCFQKKYKHKIVVYAWKDDESTITCENVQENKSPFINKSFTHSYNSIINLQYQNFNDTVTGHFDDRNIEFSLLNSYFINSYIFTANNNNISGTNLAHSYGHCLTDTTVILSAFNWPEDYIDLNVFRRYNNNDTWTEIPGSMIQTVSIPNLNIGNKEWAPYFTRMLKEKLDTVMDPTYLYDYMQTYYEYSFCYQSNCGNADSTLCLKSSIIIQKPLAHIPRKTTPVCSHLNDSIGALKLKNTFKRGGYKYTYKPWGSYRVFGIIDSFSYEIRKDNIYNGIYDELCSVVYKIGTVSATQDVNISALLPGDYKIYVTPIIPWESHLGYYRNRYNHELTVEDVNNCSTNTYSFTFTIDFNPIQKPLGDDRILCQDSTVILSIPESYTTDGNSAVWGTAYCGTNSEVSEEILHQRKVVNGGGGYHTVTITTTEGCLIKDTVIVADLKPATLNYQLPTALATNAVKYASGWPTQYSTIQWEDKDQLEYFADANIYFNGSAGIFRPIKSYDYSDSLNSSANLVRSDAAIKPVSELEEINIRNTGNIIDYKLFNYGNPLFSDCVPQWVFNNEMTKYSPSGYDIENKDILDIHNSALYGYRDKLPIAVCSNAKVDEIGYESFEEYTIDTYGDVTQLTNSTGNIDVIKETESLMMPKLKQYEIVRAFNRYALIKGNICSACDEPFVAKVDAQSLPYDFTTEKIKFRSVVSNKTKVMASPCGDSTYTILRLDELLPSDEMSFKCSFWSGSVSSVTKKYVPHIGPFNLQLDDDIAHTGVYSLQLPANERILIPQFDLELIPKKKYHIGAWVHHTDMYTLSPENLKYLNQEDSVGILIILPNNEKAFAFPTGEVINGWQRVEGTFTMPSGMRTEIQIGFVGKRIFNVDDIRIFPQNSAIQTYVYDPQNYKVRSVLDQNNYATIYQYDDEGNLFTIKKETVKGIKTIQVSNSHIKSTKP